ncbi:MAG: DUF4317 domain-containing protein [Ruminococcus sp.]|jgi:hypothetical protein|nr:DUF4317 domain-containing protein [Ruminococcus sp.]
MNKRELGELRRHFQPDDGLFVINRVLSCYVDASKELRAVSASSFSTYDSDDADIIFETLKKSLSGSVGKNLVEYAFPNDQYAEEGTQKLLYSSLRDGLKTDKLNEKLLRHIAAALHCETTYSLIIAQCSYAVITKNKNGDKLDSADLDYTFLLAAVAPVKAMDSALVYDEKADKIVCRHSNTLQINTKCTDGFLFPVFSDRAPDVNSVLCYSKSAGKPNVTMVEGVLGCEFVRAPKSERQVFAKILEDTLGDELDYTKIVEIDKKIRELSETTQNETELAVVDSARLGKILYEVGVSDEKRKPLPQIFEENAGKEGFTAVNLLTSRVALKTEMLTVTISGGESDKIRTQNINGRKCLIIDLDDPTIKINGIETAI